MRGISQKDFRPITRALSVQKKKASENTVLCIKHKFQLKLVCSIHSFALLSQGTVLQLTTDYQMICDHRSLDDLYTSTYTMSQKLCCALYVRCALSALEKECRKVWGARYTLGARYRSENTVLNLCDTTTRKAMQV